MSSRSLRRRVLVWSRALLTSIVLGCLAGPLAAQVTVTTHHNDNGRTGANLSETILTPANVNVNQFGKLFSYPVDGDIYTQPLVLPNVNIPGKGVHNVVFVATMNDSVYAFDADSNAGATALPLWQVNFTNPAAGVTTVPIEDVGDPGSGNIRRPGPVGIVGTPAIDASTGTLYVVARTKENGAYFQRLHALDIGTGAEKFGGPVAIQATARGVAFDPRRHNQRPGLALDRNTIYIAWAAHDDISPSHGWVMAYDATTLQQTGAFIVTPSGTLGGIWQSGQAPAIDANGDLYLMTGNGTFTAPGGGSDYSQSFIKLSSRTLTLLDWFAQCDVDTWNLANEDLSSAGVLLLPNTNLLLGGGKEGRMFLLNRSNLGHVQQYNATGCTNPQIPQSFMASTGAHLHGSPVYYNNPTLGPTIYMMAETDFLKGFAFNGTTVNPVPVTQSVNRGAPGMPGGFLSISANGSLPGTGIVWVNTPFALDAENAVVNGVLRAFDASNLGVELWNSKMFPARDDFGNFGKFVPPTVANGKVYVATFSNQLVVYGQNPPPPQTGTIALTQFAYATPQTPLATVTVTMPGPQGSGNMNIVAVGWNDTTSSVQSVTDNAGNVYTLAIGPTRGTGLSQSIYYAKNIVGGNNTVTVNFNAPAVYVDVRVLEYFGIDTLNPLDGVAGAFGNSITSSSGAITTTAPNELIFGANMVATLTTQAGSPFVARVITDPDGDIAQDAIVSAIGSYNATASLSSAGPWVMQIAAFKASGSAPAQAPTVTGVSPSSGTTAGGTAVTISGTNFASGATVSIGGTPATNVVFVSSTTLTATTAAHAAGAGDVVVTNPSGQTGTLPAGFTYVSPLPAPTLTSVSPNRGPAAGGTAVTLTGTNFVSGASVTFGGTAATGVAVVNATTITATAPAHAAGAVTVVVTNPSGQSASLASAYTYVAAPTVVGVSPASGATAGGTSVTVTGTGFVAGATLSFGGAAATNVVVVSATSITAVTPAHAAGAVAVVVTNPDGQAGTLANGYTFTTGVPAPTITGISPNNGPTGGGTAVTISGSNFVAGATVTIGGVAATSVVVTTSSSISAVTPAHAAGLVNVQVTNPDTQSATLTNGFTYGSVPVISFVQVAAATPQSPTTVVAVPFASAQTAGDLNIVVVGWNDTTQTVQAVQDSNGNVYSLAIGPTSGTGLRQSIYYASNIRSGPNTVTVTFSGAAIYADIRIVQYRGVSTLDAKIGASGSSATASSGAATTTAPNELIFGANTVATATRAAGTGFTSRIITNPDGDIAMDRVVSATGSYSASTPLTSSGPWVMQMVTFR